MALMAKNRLANKKKISFALQKGASYKSPFFRIVFIKKNTPHSEVLVMISKKKIDNRATVRNKLRRKFIDIIYSEIKTITKAYIIVIFPYPSSVNVSKNELQKNIQKGFEYIKKSNNTKKTIKKFTKKEA